MTSVPPSGRARACRALGLDSGLEEPQPPLDALLADLGSRIRRGGRIEEPPPLLQIGVPEIDRLLRGGLPRGRLCEISGSPSSGRTSLALALLATTTQRGECVAVVDRADAFDPPSAEAAGVDLQRVLWVRTPDWHETLRCTERILETDGFPLVLLDTASAASQAPAQTYGVGAGERSPAVWLRLARRAAATRTALVLLSVERLAGPRAEIALEMQPARGRFTGTPALLKALETRVLLVRHRTAPIDRATPVRLETATAA